MSIEERIRAQSEMPAGRRKTEDRGQTTEVEGHGFTARNAGKVGKARKAIAGWVSFLAFPCPVRRPQDLSHWGRLSSLSHILPLLTTYQKKRNRSSTCSMKDEG